MTAAAALLLASAATWLLSPLGEDSPPPAATAQEHGLAVTGIAVRDEAAVYAPAGETLVLAAEGERVRAGGVIAAVAGTRDGLLQAVRDCAADNSAVVRQAVRDAVLAAALDAPEMAAPFAALYAPDTDEPYELVTAPESALWSRSTDSLEYLSPASLAELMPEELRALLTLTPHTDGEALGRLVYSDTWYFAAAVPTGAGIEAGARVSLDFGGFTAGARVLYAGEASGGERAVVFSVTEKLGEALYERICEAEIILDS